MRIVIAGGKGLIGRSLIRSLYKDEHEIVVLSRNPTAGRGSLPAGVQLAHWDARKLGEWSQLVDGADVLVNFAGENIGGERFFPDRWTADKKRELVDSRVRAGEVVVRSIEKAANRPKVLIQASAIGYYGPTGEEIITEADQAGTDFLAKVCVAWEDATKEATEHGVRRVVLRTGLILSPEGGPLPRLVKQFRLFGSGPFGSGKQWWPWIHLSDVVGAIRFLMQTESAEGPFNITSPTPVTNRTFSKELGRALGRPSFWPIPAFAMRVLVGEVSVVVLKGQRAVPEKLSELGYRFRFSDLEEALLDIFRPQ